MTPSQLLWSNSEILDVFTFTSSFFFLLFPCRAKTKKENLCWGFFWKTQKTETTSLSLLKNLDMQGKQRGVLYNALLFWYCMNKSV